MTAMINMYNARQFLEEGKFERAEDAQVGGASAYCSCLP
jgi:hypothetical protein